MFGAPFPSDDVEFLKAWIAEARGYVPDLPDSVATAITEFYLDMRSSAWEDDSPIPVTARQLEGLVRLTLASARARHSTVVEQMDVQLAIELTRQMLQDVGLDTESGEFDADLIETGTAKSQRDRIKSVRSAIRELQSEYETGVPVDEVIDEMSNLGVDASKTEQAIDRLRQRGEAFEPEADRIRLT